MFSEDSILRDTYRRGKRRIRQLIGLEPRFGIQVRCIKRYYGTGYGKWCVHPVSLDSDSIVYSVGVGKDISFDLAIIREFGMVVNAFDPTPQSIDWIRTQQLPSQLRVFEYGVADFDGIARFNPPLNPEHVSHTILDLPESAANAIEVPVFRLETIMEKLGHQQIDLLKLDVEGAEYAVIDDLLDSGVRIKQLLVEFHHRFRGVKVSDSTAAVSDLNQRGFKIFEISPSGEEYSFIIDDALTDTGL